MSASRGVIAVFLSAILWSTPVWGAPPNPLGTVISADRARLGNTSVTSGTTVFGGDTLITEQAGKVQIRAGAARLALSPSSTATLGSEQGVPTATLTAGTAVFSSASANSFALRVATAVIRPLNAQPAVGQVSVIGPKELVVRSNRGSLTITVMDDIRVISEGEAYRVVLDPSESAMAAAAQGARGAGTNDFSGTVSNRSPKRAGKSRFIWFAIGISAFVTFWAIHEALESGERP
ncbi:MAG: hypothetical protein NVS9B4_22450 [Candidatus Acidiferrum sp.]